jgi:hypothetical protein
LYRFGNGCVGAAVQRQGLDRPDVNPWFFYDWILLFYEYILLYTDNEVAMKKFIFILFILIILGGVCFVFGWINLFVPANSYGVIVSKTSGYDQTLITPGGDFVWRWENIIPTNMTIYAFKNEAYKTTVKSSGEFPSAGVYSQLEKSADFSFLIQVELVFRFNENRLISLVKDQGLTPETLDTWYKSEESSLTSEIYSFLFSLKTEDDLKLLINLPGLEKRLVSTLQENHTELRIIQATPVAPLKLPDPELYLLMKTDYLEILKARTDYQMQLIERQKTTISQTDLDLQRSELRLSQLKDYGELLNKYPILLKYLFIEKLSGQDLLKVPSGELFQKTE